MQMNTAISRAPDSSSPTTLERSAAWLHTPYPENVWIISDTHDPSRTETLDLRYQLPNGRMLTDEPWLLATVKEYAWWVRDPRFSRIDDAVAHVGMVRNLMHIAHLLILRNIHTFAHVVPYDIEQIVERCRFGLDAVLDASARVERHIQALRDGQAGVESSDLPLYVVPKSGRSTTTVASERLVAACHLPRGTSRLPRVAWHIAVAAQAAGFRSRAVSDEKPALQNQTVQALQRWLDPLEQLYAMRQRLAAETLTFRPFPRGAAKVAAVKGVTAERTPTPPPRLVLHLLDGAARHLADHLEARPTSAAAIRSVATACWILIAAFTARRDEEIDDLQDDCLRGDEKDGWWLEIYIEKTLQRKETIPVPTLVARAVEMLLEISAEARTATATSEILQWIDGSGAARRIDVGRHLDAFAKQVGVPLHEARGQPPEAWHWHPHQFRRFFAILYFYRFEGATIEALSHHLRHFSLEMTRRYITRDREVAALWTDVEWGYMGHIARSIAAGERSVSGAAGERLKKTARKIMDALRRRLQVVSPERVGASLTLLMQRQGLVLTPKPWVTCSCPRTIDATAVAACRRGQAAGADGPDFAQAGPTVCGRCPHAIVDGAQQAMVAAEIEHLNAAASSTNRAATLFGALEAARLIEITEVKDARYAAATPLVNPAADLEPGS